MRGLEGEGEGEEEGGMTGGGRGEKMGGREKEENFARSPLQEGRRETRGREWGGKGVGGVEAYPLSAPSLISLSSVSGE